MQPNYLCFDKLHCFLLKSSAKPQFSWADLAKISIFAKGKTSLQRGVENFLIRHDLGFSKRQKKIQMGDNICKTFFLKKSDNFPFDLGQISIVRQLYGRWAPKLECDKVSTNGDKCL